jgi:hypothetical protein
MITNQERKNDYYNLLQILLGNDNTGFILDRIMYFMDILRNIFRSIKAYL